MNPNLANCICNCQFCILSTYRQSDAHTPMTLVSYIDVVDSRWDVKHQLKRKEKNRLHLVAFI